MYTIKIKNTRLFQKTFTLLKTEEKNLNNLSILIVVNNYFSFNNNIYSDLSSIEKMNVV